MAKAKIAARKKGSKRGKATAKPARKAAAKRTTVKKTKSKVRRARTPMTKKQRSPKAAASEASSKIPNQMVEVPVEDTVIDVIEEPVPGGVDVTEDATIQTENSIPTPAPLS
jgi:hypothetical protein